MGICLSSPLSMFPLMLLEAVAMAHAIKDGPSCQKVAEQILSSDGHSCQKMAEQILSSDGHSCQKVAEQILYRS